MAKTEYGPDLIARILPHRPPFLFVDRVVGLEPGAAIEAERELKADEPHFAGHFPGRPVMPGVIALEALAQTAGILTFVTAGIYPDETVKFYFAGIDKARFRRPIVPGDQLVLRARLERRIRTIWKYSTVAEVAGEEACSAEMMVMPG